ncbi:MAG TPA: F0F1 ATP synthase subunit alpha, partial [Ktedonobacterales bacterium]|nr:F0F1 ATP synthase subunit alpha [Ktedonobacterales bacterium]
MAITDEITRVIRDRIQNFEGPSAESTTTSVGTVITVADGIARVYGLSGARYLELLEFPRTNIYGIAFNLEEDSVAVPIMGDYTQLRENDEVRTTGRIISVPVGDALIGRIVNPLGEPLDDAGPINTTRTRPVERVAPGVITRQSVTVPVQTGLKAIDAL